MPTTSSSRHHPARSVIASLTAISVAGFLTTRYLVPASYPTSFAERLPNDADDLTIAEPARALTFARMQQDGHCQLILVRAYRAGVVEGVDVPNASDPVDAFAKYGYDRLRDIALNPASVPVTVPSDDLLPPFVTRRANIAMGTNFPGHGAETSIDSAFLFPKLVEPTSARSRLAVDDGLLDYEVELGLVPLEDLHAGATNPEHVGLVLTNDWTDRKLLLERANPNDLTAGTGFTDAKSKQGYLTIGDLFVIPAHWQSYYRGLRIELYLGEHLRQRATPAAQIWDASTMLAQIWAAGGRTWDFKGSPQTITSQVGVLPSRTILQSGTPAGVIFRPPSIRQIILGSIQHMATLGLSAHSFTQAAVRLYIAEAEGDHAYLQPGDRVTSRSNGLGRIITDIVSAAPATEPALGAITGTRTRSLHGEATPASAREGRSILRLRSRLSPAVADRSQARPVGRLATIRQAEQVSADPPRPRIEKSRREAEMSEIRWPAGYEVSGADIYVLNSGFSPASVEQVWSWLVRPDHWNEIYPNASHLRSLQGPWPKITLGSQFSWRTLGTRVTTTVTEHEAYERLAWTGTGTGARVHHAWLLRPRNGGGCEIVTAETQRGTSPRLLRPFLRPTLLRVHQQWIDTLASTAAVRSPASR